MRLQVPYPLSEPLGAETSFSVFQLLVTNSITKLSNRAIVMLFGTQHL